MSKRFMGPRGRVVVAVDLGEQSGKLIELACEIARRTGMKIRLVHVVEPWVTADASRHLPLGSLRDVAQAVDDATIMAAEKKLREFAVRYSSQAEIETEVVLHHVASGVMSAATDASLILTGTSHAGERVFLRGFSTALSLMAASPIPVMVVDAKVEVDLASPDRRLVIVAADDLRAGGEAAIHCAMDLGRALGKTDVHHLTVDVLTPEMLARASDILEDRGVASDEFIEEAARLAQDARERVATYQRGRVREKIPLLEAAGGGYHAFIKEGKVGKAIDEHVREVHADIVIYGRHQPIHRQPFGIGRVPFEAMLASQSIVVVAPDI